MKKQDEPEHPDTGPITWPAGAKPVSPYAISDSPLLDRFLQRRRIPLGVCLDYKVRFTGGVGQYANRLIIPILSITGRLLAWQARDMTDSATAKYLTKGGIEDLLYWSIYTMGAPRRIYLVEGVLDCWRMGHSCAASFSHALTRRQRKILINDDPNELVFAWDSDSYDLALKAAREMAPIMKSVGIVRLPEGQDPDSYGEEEVRMLEVRWL